MKYLSLLLLLICAPAYSLDFTAGYEKHLTPNKGNNYSDGQGYYLGLKHDIYKDLKGQIDVTHMTDIHFPTDSDPKGSFGELRAYGAIYNLIFKLPYNKNVSFNLQAGAGPMFWDFKENPHFQDSRVTVDVDPSFVLKAGAGMEIKIYDKWHIELNVGWLDTTIGKNVHNENGESMNLLDADDHINLRYITARVGISKEF
jgi:hypothetical protein